jgi:hypothetical protein
MTAATSPLSLRSHVVYKKALYFMNEVFGLTAQQENSITFTTFNWPLQLFIISHSTSVVTRNIPKTLTDHRLEPKILTLIDTSIGLCSNPDRNKVQEVNENGITSRFHAFEFRIVSYKPYDQVYCDFWRSSNLDCWTINTKCTKIQSFLLDVKWRFVVKVNYVFRSKSKLCVP